MSAKQLLPLSGVLAVVLIVVAAIITGEPPDTDAPNDELLSYYTDNESELQVGAGLLGLGSFFFLLFSAAVASLVRGVREATSAAANVTLAGGIIIAVGMTIFAGLAFTAGEAVDDVEIGTIQTLHALEMNMFFTVAVGVGAFLLGAGIGTLKTDALPAWLAWAAIVIGVVAVTPLGFFGFLALGIWTVIVSVMLFLRARETTGGAAPAGGAPSGPASPPGGAPSG
jgi:hypothetical protein